VTATVIIPAFNRASVIARAISSVKTSSNNYEVIVVDDGSTDSTAAVVLQHTSDNCKLLRLPRRTNANAARNAAIRAAKGRLLVFLDSDDEFLTHRLSGIIDYFTENNVDILVDNFITHKRRRSSAFSFLNCGQISDGLRQALSYHAIPITFSSISVKRDVLLDMNFLDERCLRHQDRDFLLSAVDKNYSIHLRNSCDVVKHQRADSFSRSAAGYMTSLEYIIAKHGLFSKADDIQVKHYLISRTLISSMARLDLRAAFMNYLFYKQSTHLSKGGAPRILHYFQGKNARKNLASLFIRPLP
jgi:glycosyltransferase involved in cell wall biosynthesis